MPHKSSLPPTWYLSHKIISSLALKIQESFKLSFKAIVKEIRDGARMILMSCKSLAYTTASVSFFSYRPKYNFLKWHFLRWGKKVFFWNVNDARKHDVSLSLTRAILKWRQTIWWWLNFSSEINQQSCTNFIFNVRGLVAKWTKWRHIGTTPKRKMAFFPLKL